VGVVARGRTRSHCQSVPQEDGSWLHTTVCSPEGRIACLPAPAGSSTAVVPRWLVAPPECALGERRILARFGEALLPSLITQAAPGYFSLRRPEHPRDPGGAVGVPSRRSHLLRQRQLDRSERAAGLMSPLTDVAIATITASPVQPSNEEMQQTRSALTSTAAALAADLWCSADCSDRGQ
jgi:hypothetical protein